MTENQLRYLSYQESSRHNVATEQQAARELDETARSNLAKETETHRSNVAKETETHRANVAKENETHRANTAQEAIKLDEHVIKRDELRERKRSNLENERMAREKHATDRTYKAIDAATNVVKAITPWV